MPTFFRRHVPSALLIVFSLLYLSLFTTIFGEINTEVRAAVAGVALTLAATLYSHRQTSQRAVSERLFSDRRDLLDQFIHYWVSGLESADKWTVERNMVLCGGEATVRAWFSLRDHPPGEFDNPVQAREFLTRIEALLRAMRRDLGHQDSGLSRYALLDLIVGTTYRRKVEENGFPTPNPVPDELGPRLEIAARTPRLPAATLGRAFTLVISSLSVGFLVIAFLYDITQVSASVRAVLLGYVGTFFAAILYHQKAWARDATSRLYAGKRRAYGEFLDLFHKFNSAGSEMTTAKAAEMQFPLSKLLMSWASPAVLSAWRNAFGGTSVRKKDEEERLGAIVTALRRDLGHTDHKTQAKGLATLLS